MTHSIRTSTLLAAVLLLSFGRPVSAQLMMPGTPRSAYLDCANVSMALYSVSVGGVYYDLGGVNGFHETAFYIGYGNFLSCAHGVRGNDGIGGGIGNVSIRFGTNLNTPTMVVPVDKMERHPLYGGDTGSPYDIVMFHSPASSLAPVPALGILQGPVAVGTRFTGLGYGDFGYPGAINSTDGLLSGYENTVTRFGFPTGISTLNWLSRFGWPGDPGLSPINGMALPGFSGGPKLVQDGDTYKVGAINAFWYGRQDYGGYDGGLGLDSLNPWIDATRSTIPEPSTATVLAFGILALVASRRRQ